MRQTWIDQILHQTQIAGHISGRDVIKRVGSATMMVAVCGMAGFWVSATIVMGIILLLEIWAYPINKRASRFEEALDIRTAMLVFSINWAAMLPFLSFAVILSHSDSLPFVLAGYLWAFGIFVHVSNMFGLLPLYNWSQMTPAFGTVFLMLWNLSNNPSFEAGNVPWFMTALLTTVYIVNTFDTMNLQNDTHRALSRAREEANARLIELERLSRSDSLTGLMNRRAFDETVQSMMHQHANKQGVTVFVIDLDGFKPINDSYSHDAGDAVLKAVAQRLNGLVGRDGRVARLGGDEFAIIRSCITSEKEARAFGAKITEVIALPIPYEQKMLGIRTSIGIARQGADADTPNALLSGADQAMFMAKQDAERRPVIYDKAAFPVRATLEDRQILLNAMQTGQILPHYQPKIDLTNNRIIGFEALSRWQHPQRGLLAPSEFLPQINELGLQGDFMIHTAEYVLKNVQLMVDDGLDPGQVSINVSEVTLATPSGRHELFALIEQYPDIRRNLTFEITEDIFIARSGDVIRESIRQFRDAGVRISLDDFGTGFASLHHLKELEFDELKLDTGFIRDLGVDPAAHVLVEGMITISRGLNVDLIAEGVETEQQRDMLFAMGCRKVQGHFYGAATPHEEAFIRLSTQGTPRDRRNTAKLKSA